MAHRHDTDIRRLARHAEALRRRLLRRWVAQCLRRLAQALTWKHGETELRAMDERELHDLGLDRGSIAYAARHGRER